MLVGLYQDQTMLYNLDLHRPDSHMFCQFVNVLSGLITPRFSIEQISVFYQLFINVSMKLLIAFSLWIVLIVLQEQISCYFLSISASPGYYQDGDFVIGGLLSLKVSGRHNKNKFTSGNEYNLPEYVYM